MSTRIGLIADIHAFEAPLEEALKLFRNKGVDKILCLGDIAGYGNELEESVALLKQYDCTTVLGNHEARYLDRIPEEQQSSLREYFSSLPLQWESVIDGVRIYAVHASPPDSLSRGIRLLDENGAVLAGEKERWCQELTGYPFDVLLVGHTHQVFAEWFRGKLVINPGSTKFNHTCAILSLPDKQVEMCSLSGKEPVKAWNWGMMTRGENSASEE